MSSSAWLILYCVLILLASLAGGWIPMLVRLTHKRLELAVSFVAGVMLGVGLLHMLPHAIEMRLHDHEAHEHIAHQTVIPLMIWLLAGFLVMFLIERFFCFHHHDAPVAAGGIPPLNGDHHHHHHLTWTGAAIGLSVHSVIEGIALAASAQADHLHAHDSAWPLGLAIFLVIALHKPFDSLTLGTLMTVGRRSARSRHLVNAAFSLLIPLGVALFYLGLAGGDGTQALTSAALAFSAGTFLCIAMSDLLPELQFHQHDRIKLSLALLAGLALALMMSFLEARIHE